jgi:DNA-binding transcriptional ArsR family regulator
MRVSRHAAARQCVAVFDTGFFKALCEPARIAVLRELILLGRGDIAAIADRLPQDRSVVARHLRQLAAAQIVKAEKEGRHDFYQIDARGAESPYPSVPTLATDQKRSSTARADAGSAHDVIEAFEAFTISSCLLVGGI